MSVRVYQLAKDLGMESREIMQLLHKRGLKVTSASSSIPNIYATALIEELKNIPGETIQEREIVEKETEENFPRESTEKEENLTQMKESAARVSEESSQETNSTEDGDFDRISVEKKEKNSVSLPNTAPMPKKFIKIPLPKTAPKTPTVFIEKNEVAAKVSSVRVISEEDGRRVSDGSTVAISNRPEMASAEPKLPEKLPENVRQNRVAEGNRRKAPPVNFKEKRAAPTVHFQFMSKSQRSDAPFNAMKIPGVSEPLEGKGGEGKVLVYRAPIIVRDFAQKIGLKPFQLISELMRQGVFASMNQQITDDIAINIAEKQGFRLEIRQKPDPSKQNIPKAKVVIPKELLPRPPVVCVLGHVDHGKTTLLDTIRHSSVVSGEAGGITQHVGAYQVDHKGKKITFLDTPGHAAFSNMRERGANVTDIAILVVAADDGFMPQTDEALKFAKKAGIPVVVAINKIDAKGANLDRVKQQMQQRGIAPEEWGGDTLCTGISALKGTNVDELLSQVLLQAEIMELKADYKCPASGIIIESQIDAGRGAVATVIIQEGTLKVGDALVCAKAYCRVRSMLNERSENVKLATPSMSVKIIGWNEVPNSGDIFETVKDEKTAKKQAEENENNAKLARAEPVRKIANVKTLFEAMASQDQKILKVVLKCDVHGTMEALIGCLGAIKSDRVKLEILTSGVGLISKNDVEFARTSEAIIVGFNVKTDNGVAPLAKNKNVRVRIHNIIYELIDQVKEEMKELLDFEYTENHLGTAEIRRVFDLARVIIAGCMVIDGQIIRDKLARIRRGDKVLFEGKIDSLRRQKDDYSEVRSGFECGIRMEGFSAFEEGDTIECFEMIQHRQTL
ncbi:MAG: translation initiation factor IF-2 [Puniceicoccales bacterium]|jgi:translation initiation factor IF-2|nr:translation initiation factor IF-2 [Puniceicoccales bacterium]